MSERCPLELQPSLSGSVPPEKAVFILQTTGRMLAADDELFLLALHFLPGVEYGNEHTIWKGYSKGFFFPHV
jgi:hypothetical protein